MRKPWKIEKPIAVVSLIALALSLAVAPGVASARVAQDGPAVGVKAMDDVPEWAVADGADAQSGKMQAQPTLPKKYDLRSDGLVTPVKSQSPWNTCWAFAGIAAAETSMLSANGFTAEESRLDLSERHLAYFALHPVTEVDDPVQAGEGLVTVSGDSNAAFAAGGMSMYITSLFSQGVGPHTEAMFPYRGKNGTRGFVPVITFEEFEEDPEQGTLITLAAMHGTDVEVQKAALEAEAANRGMDYEAVLAEAIAELRGQYAGGSYARDDDWSIPEKGDDGRSNRTLNPVLTMKDGNVLPEYWNDQNKTQLNDASVAAMKQELVNGRGVSISYTADQAQPGQTADTRYINHDTWAQYTFEPERSTHAVCIVGYDDDYPASNFTHDVLTRATDGNGNWVVDANGGYVLAKDENGQPYVDPAATEASTPPGNGAWIVKNSWGSETDKTTDDLGNVTGNGTYGVRDADGKATGYFYLSYYDRSIVRPETMAFSASLLDDSDSFEVLQHDYMAAQNGFYTTEASSDVTSSANVFEVPHDLSIKAVSTLMPEENQHVTFSIYRMDDGATTPTDGTMLYRTSCNFEYAGFHRLDLERPVAVKGGEKIAVVSTASTLNADGARMYKVSATQAISKEVVDVVNTNSVVLPIYGNAVVNKGESFLYKDGVWVDWSEYLAGLPKPPEEEGDPHISGDAYTDMYPVDNFSIKLYGSPVEITLAHQEAKAATCAEPGNIEYWYYDALEGTDSSDSLRIYYADEAGTTEISQADTIIAIDPDAHDWGPWTALDGAQHQRVCKNDPSHVEKEAHKWTDGSDACEVCGLAYPKPSVNNSKGGSFASTSDEITYTVTQEVPGWATSVRLWTDLEPVLLYTVDEDDVTVTTSDGSTLTGVSVSIDGQRLAVDVDDASDLRGQDVQFSYKARVRDDADLTSYLNDAKDTASVPYRASVSFDGADKEVSSDTGHVKFKVSASRSGSSKADSDQSGIVKTGDSLLYVCSGIVAVAATAAAVSAFANRRRKRN